MHKVRAHSGYSLWYCRQHCSTLSSLFSAVRPSAYKERQTGREKGTERQDMTLISCVQTRHQKTNTVCLSPVKDQGDSTMKTQDGEFMPVLKEILKA